MTSTKNKLMLTLLALAVLGLGSGLFRGTATADPVARVAVPEREGEKKEEANKETDLARLARTKLAQRVDFAGLDANTPLKDALDFLRDTYRLPIFVDEASFQAIEVQKVEEQPVQLPKMHNVRLGTVLRLLLKQIRGNRDTGSFLIRPDGIEVTTTFAVTVEVLGTERTLTDLFGGQPDADTAVIDRVLPLDSVVSVEFDRKPLNEALRELAEQHGINVVLDPRAGDKAKTPVTLTLNNVLADSLVRVLADMAELRAVTATNITYITTKANAETILAEQAKRQAKRAQAAGAGPGLAPAAPGDGGEVHRVLPARAPAPPQ